MIPGVWQSCSEYDILVMVDSPRLALPFAQQSQLSSCPRVCRFRPRFHAHPCTFKASLLVLMKDTTWHTAPWMTINYFRFCFFFYWLENLLAAYYDFELFPIFFIGSRIYGRHEWLWIISDLVFFIYCIENLWAANYD